jgi:hypothetical protein
MHLVGDALHEGPWIRMLFSQAMSRARLVSMLMTLAASMTVRSASANSRERPGCELTARRGRPGVVAAMGAFAWLIPRV